MKLLVQPLAIIRGSILLIVQRALAVDLVVVEISLVVGSVIVQQLPIALFQSVLAHALVLDTVLEEFL